MKEGQRMKEGKGREKGGGLEGRTGITLFLPEIMKQILPTKYLILIIFPDQSSNHEPFPFYVSLSE